MLTATDIYWYLDAKHPEWDDSELRYYSQRYADYLNASGATMADLQKNGQAILEAVDAQYGEYSTVSSAQGGGGALAPWDYAMQAAKQYYGGAPVDDATLQSLASTFLSYYQSHITDPAQMIAKYNEMQGLGGTGATTIGQQGGYNVLQDEAGNVIDVIGPVEASATSGEPYKDPSGTLWLQQDSNGNVSVVGNVQQNESWGGVQYDANGNAYQVDSSGQIHYTGGTAPTAAASNAPGWAGWGQDWASSQRYNPTSGMMETTWGKTPMSAEDTLAQAQSANLRGNWYNTALLQRQQAGAYTGNQAGTPGFTGQGGSYGPGYSTFVPETVGRLVGAKQGYAPNYDLQTGQNAMGVTPSGWYQDWNRGYTNGQANPGGGYQTYTASMQDWNRMAPSQRSELSGWLNTGFGDYSSEDDYYAQMKKLAAPSGGGMRLYYR